MPPRMPRSPSARSTRKHSSGSGRSSEGSSTSTRPAYDSAGIIHRPTCMVSATDSRQPPQVRPVTRVAGPDQVHGSAGTSGAGR